MEFTKPGQKHLDSPRRELSNGGLGIVVALLVRWEINVCMFILEIQSSCKRFSRPPPWTPVLVLFLVAPPF